MQVIDYLHAQVRYNTKVSEENGEMLGAIVSLYNSNSRTHSKIAKLDCNRYNHCNEIITANLLKHNRKKKVRNETPIRSGQL